MSVGLIHASEKLGNSSGPCTELAFSDSSARLDETGRLAAIECLARMAAEFAGRDPDAKVKIELAEKVVFDDEMWRYPAFIQRAQTALAALTS